MLLLAVILFSVFSPASGIECPDDWVSFENSCYVYVNDVATWTGAQTICALLHSRLVEIESAEENNFIVSQMKLRNVPKTWLGFNDFVREGRYVWTSTGEPMEYSNWKPGEPNNDNWAAGDQDCGALYVDGTWDDENCENVHSHMFTFFCETRNIEGEGESIIG
ncbi:low affinity immunoglobulin epsilon Fc receptor-like [Babylonia areolata]|uniref:low affinity immunoglobulin epsilon Fc receptor-like n=1 Tax=Babylonia areolata TaxID=304850 RepID=UPI003FD11964